MAPPKQYLGNKTRGGSDQFQWDSVKEEKYRENYLGHSVMAPLGRWQRGKDLTWFTKKGQHGHNAKSSGELEIARLKLQEEELMLKVLSGEVIEYGNKLDKFGVNKLTAKTVQAEINLNEKEVEQMPGVGYNSIGIGPSLREQLSQVSHSVLQAKGMGDDGKTPLPTPVSRSGATKKEIGVSGREDDESRHSSSHRSHRRFPAFLCPVSSDVSWSLSQSDVVHFRERSPSESKSSSRHHHHRHHHSDRRESDRSERRDGSKQSLEHHSSKSLPSSSRRERSRSR
jgi:hypothetical protein